MTQLTIEPSLPDSQANALISTKPCTKLATLHENANEQTIFASKFSWAIKI